ncbi:hypothetical protein AB669_10715 [Pedobacter sp. BMA]|nr:hypothetical protein AB669_10715 [Pedobacter sp. BMA]
MADISCHKCIDLKYLCWRRLCGFVVYKIFRIIKRAEFVNSYTQNGFIIVYMLNENDKIVLKNGNKKQVLIKFFWDIQING